MGAETNVTITVPRKDAEWLLAQVGKLTGREVSALTYQALQEALESQTETTAS